MGAQSDVYAIGVLLYRMLTDRLPFDVHDLPWAEAIQQILETEPPPIGALNPALAGLLDFIVARAMARDPNERFQTAADLETDLQAFLDGRQPATAAPPSALERSPARAHAPRWRC